MTLGDAKRYMSYVNTETISNADVDKKQHANSQKSLWHPLQKCCLKQGFHVFGDLDL